MILSHACLPIPAFPHLYNEMKYSTPFSFGQPLFLFFLNFIRPSAVPSAATVPRHPDDCLYSGSAELCAPPHSLQIPASIRKSVDLLPVCGRNSSDSRTALRFALHLSGTHFCNIVIINPFSMLSASHIESVFLLDPLLSDYFCLISFFLSFCKKVVDSYFSLCYYNTRAKHKTCRCGGIGIRA